MPSETPPRLSPAARLGLAIAAVVLVLDQALKLWVIKVLELRPRESVRVAPGIDLVMTWNTGISYGLFPQNSDTGRWILVGITVVAVAFLTVWLIRTQTRLAAVALGLIIGGAVGNAIDRVTFGAVADFVLLYVATATWRFDWYVFNLADAAIVAGVIGLVYESLFQSRAAKAP